MLLRTFDGVSEERVASLVAVRHARRGMPAAA